jgi:transcriptional regulator with XRE-family HTH domain
VPYPVSIYPPVTGNELRRLRRRAGLSQRALATRVGLHWNTVARMERSELAIREVAAHALRAVCSAPKTKGGRHE